MQRIERLTDIKQLCRTNKVAGLSLDWSGTIVTERSDTATYLAGQAEALMSKLAIRDGRQASNFSERFAYWYAALCASDPYCLVSRVAITTCQELEIPCSCSVDELDEVVGLAFQSLEELQPDVSGFIDWLEWVRLSVLITTNTRHAEVTFWRWVRDAVPSLEKHLVGILTSCSIGVRKPNRQIADAMQQRLRLPAEMILHVGDQAEADGGLSRWGLQTAVLPKDR